jgi:hypothetical protein
VLNTPEADIGLSRHLCVRQITAAARERQDTHARLQPEFWIQPSRSDFPFARAVPPITVEDLR